MSNVPKISPVSQELANKIRTELVEKNYYNDVDYNINSKSRWKRISDINDTLAHIMTGLAAIMAFAAGFFNYRILSFISGCLATLSLVFLQFASFAMKESKERTQQVNILLEQLSIDKIPDITIESTTSADVTEV